MALGIAIAACSSASNVAPAATHCTVGSYVFCRCEDRSEGTKLCRADGASFDECKCDGSNPPPTDPDAGPGEEDGGGIKPPTIGAKCIGKLALVAGHKDDLDTYVGWYKGDGAFGITKTSGLPLLGAATLLPSSNVLVATYYSRQNRIAWAKYGAGGTWSVPTDVGDGFAQSVGPTYLTLVNGQPRLFYLGKDTKYHQGFYTQAGWDAATTLAEPTAGPNTVGKSAPAAAAVGSSITLAFTAPDGSLSRESYDGTWSAPSKILTGGTYAGLPPAIVALDAGGPKDLLMVYLGADVHLHLMTRDAATKAWSSPALFDNAASASDFSLTAISGGRAMLAFKAGNKAPGFYSIWTKDKGFGPPVPLVDGTNPQIGSAPSITRGQCGSEATLAYAEQDGPVKILQYIGGKMMGPYDVAGIPKATYVGVGELP